MNLHFIIKHFSLPGESLSVRISGNNEVVDFPLDYTDSARWEGNIAVRMHGARKIKYSVLFKSAEKEKTLFRQKINQGKYKSDTICVFHENTAANKMIRLNGLKPFSKILRQRNIKKAKTKAAKDPTHIFKVDLPRLQDNIFLCLAGSAKKTGGFNPAKPLLFGKKKNGKCNVQIDLSKEQFPVEYKFAFYDADKKTIIGYEAGDNRIIHSAPCKKELNIFYPDIDFDKYLWKAAGVNIPVFSLRSENSWGTGEFTDIHLLADWAAAVGLKLIQLLPINDTIASYTDKDSYPYSAISSFALHPQFLHIEKPAAHLGVEITREERQEIKRLNDLPAADYSAVVKLKLQVLKRLFEKERFYFRDDMDWFSFFDMNREWLVPYAVFCTLRDKYGTADYGVWPQDAAYDEERVQAIAAPGSEDYETVLFWYYVQYRLHLQLKDAVDYTHSKKIILKADLPIGVGRFSADTRKNPGLFHMDMQAGAPPDAFSDRGQNWHFPTYNIQQMAAENFSWFRRRMEYLEGYFDAVRIDHVLGFFRIWSIPMGTEDARLGHFFPAISLTAQDFISAGLDFNEQRFAEPFTPGDAADVILIKDEEPGKFHFRVNMQQTNSFNDLPSAERNILNSLYDYYFFRLQNDLWKTEGEKKLRMLQESTTMLLCAEDLGMVPAFTEQVLHELDMLSLQVQQMPKDDKTKFSDTTTANYESVVMPATHDMPPMRLWWEQNRADAQLFLNSILKINGTAPYFCEPWLCERILEMHLASPAMWSIFLLQDILSANGQIRRPQPGEERINDPANADQVWNYRMHITLESLIGEKEFSEGLKNMIKESGR